MYRKIGILAVLASVLLSAAVLATPSLKVANAQGNQTGEMKQTTGLPVETWIKILKDKNPALASIEQSPDVKDAIGKIKAMQDPKQAVETFNALQALQQLMNLKSAQEAQ
ncbi:MAG TPA: hypothetical protein VH481_03010 [Nitrososphaeraceae archaeon]|jgi:hypothetical protein